MKAQHLNLIELYEQVANHNMPEGYVTKPHLEAALAAVSAAHDSGMALLPQEPTADMIAAAVAVSDATPSEVQRIWEAMLQAW